MKKIYIYSKINILEIFCHIHNIRKLFPIFHHFLRHKNNFFHTRNFFYNLFVYFFYIRSFQYFYQIRNCNPVSAWICRTSEPIPPLKVADLPKIFWKGMKIIILITRKPFGLSFNPKESKAWAGSPRWKPNVCK